MKIFDYIAGIRQNLNTINVPDDVKEYIAIYSIAEQLSARYSEIAGDYNPAEAATVKSQIIDEAVLKIEDIVSQDLGRAMYDEYMQLILPAQEPMNNSETQDEQL